MLQGAAFSAEMSGPIIRRDVWKAGPFPSSDEGEAQAQERSRGVHVEGSADLCGTAVCGRWQDRPPKRARAGRRVCCELQDAQSSGHGCVAQGVLRRGEAEQVRGCRGWLAASRCSSPFAAGGCTTAAAPSKVCMINLLEPAYVPVGNSDRHGRGEGGWGCCREIPRAPSAAPSSFSFML